MYDRDRFFIICSHTLPKNDHSSERSTTALFKCANVESSYIYLYSKIEFFYTLNLELKDEKKIRNLNL
jgi:hypothetical protein